MAELGHGVLCVDIDAGRIEALRTGRVPFFEPGLEELVQCHLESGNLLFGGTVAEAVEWAKVVFICAGTPSNQDGSADISSVEAVVREIAEHAHGYCLVVEKSTVPVTTGQSIQLILNQHKHRDAQFDVASVPEFLREGSAIQDVLEPDRMVIGASSQRAVDILKRIFELVPGPVITTDVNTAEIIKHACNGFLATKISYINAISAICEKTGADVTIVSKAMGLDHRIGSEFLEAGIGFGGSCFPKDVAAFIQLARGVGFDFDLLRAVERINQGQQNNLVSSIRQALGTFENKCIAVLGLAFKPNTDDIRESPAISIVDKLLEEGAQVRATDPKAIANAREIFRDRVHWSISPYDVATGADALVLLTEWDEYRVLDWTRIHGLLRVPLTVDGRNAWNPTAVTEAGLAYVGVGRPSASKPGKVT